MKEVRFSILGPVQVVVAGLPVPVGGPRVQAVLAALLLNPSEEVPAGSIIDMVWGDSPPPTVRTSLQVHISKIRSAFSAAGLEDRLETHGSSYVLHVSPAELDASLLRACVAEARGLLGESAPERALPLLRDALDLWRGPPLGDLEVFGSAVVASGELQDLHDLSAVLICEAQLMLGLHDEALPHLLRLRTEARLDERICELASIALYRAGRQSDALGEISSLRRVLSEELGIEPGPAILELEKRILVADAGLLGVSRVVPRKVRKTVTVVALRIPRGDPEEVLAATEALRDLFKGAVSNLGGWCPPARSNRLLGVFGVPVLHEDDALRAVRTADALSGASRALGLQVRLGVSTGDVLVEIGSDVVLRTHDPVEVADLLARKAKPNEVLVGVGTHRLIGGAADVDPAQILVLDDEESPLYAHRLRGVSDSRVAPRLAAPHVGRESDLLRMHDAAKRSFAGARPTMLLVLGSAGIGKSRLIQAFVAGLGDRVDVAVARCVPYGREAGPAPMGDIVREILGLGADRSPAFVRRRLEEFVSDDPDRDFLVESLGALLGILDSSSTRDESFWAMGRCLEIASSRQPLAVIIEDLQWADERLKQWLGYASSTLRDSPLLLVCSARPEFAEELPSWGGGGLDVATVRLDPLTAEEMEQLVRALLNSEDLDPTLSGVLVDYSEGNPLFLQEVLSVMIEDGHLQPGDEGWELASDFAAVPLPPTVKALLDARVDLLPRAERDVLEAASVVGREFSLEDLGWLRPETELDELVAALDSLSLRGLVDMRRFTSRGGNSYAFRHLLIRDVAYASIPRERRATDHESLGRSLLERAGGRLGDAAELIGFHLETAFHAKTAATPADGVDWQLGELAARHLFAAGRRAVALDDPQFACGLFERAMGCVQPGAQHADIARWRAAALFDLGRFEEAREVISTGLESARVAGDPALQWRLQLESMEVDVYTRPGRRDASETQAFAQRAIQALSDLGDAAGLARAYRLLGEAQMLQGQLDEGLAAFARGAEYGQEAGDEREVSLPQQLMGLHGTVPLTVFIGLCEPLLKNRARRPRPEVVMRLAYAQALSGDVVRADELIEQGLVLAREVGGAFRMADAELYAGLALLTAGRPEAAAASLEHAATRLADIGESNLRSTVNGFLGEACIRISDIGRAQEAARVCRSLAAHDDWASQMLWRQTDAKIAAYQGDVQSAHTLIMEAVAIADQTDFTTMKAAVYLDASVILDIHGEPSHAAAALENAGALILHKGISPEAHIGGLPLPSRA